jgi:CubicO group peptidase (beta-lactamase class C family)
MQSPFHDLKRRNLMPTHKGMSMIQKSLATSLTVAVTLMLLLSTVTPALSKQNKVSSGGSISASPAQAQGPTDPAEMEAFMDDLFAKELAENHIAGAAVSVVKDGRLFFEKGYGYANLEKGIPVDPEQTDFRIGSLTKVFTWTAVMQLAEQGKLDLDADVNNYLDFRIPDTYPQPITLRHLMTHTAGLEERTIGVVARPGEQLQPPREWLVTHMPARVRPPGEYAGYSNYAGALAGYIVARVSGEPYDQYIRDHILNPLGMAHSTAHRPMPADLAARESVGYVYRDGAFQVFPEMVGQPGMWPAGSVGTTASDMARFMIAHLQNGRYSDLAIPEVRILEDATARQMHSTLFTPDPGIQGAAYGFFDFSDNGQRTIGHGGTAEPTHSLLLLLPDQNLGLFVTYNTLDADTVASQHFGFQRALFDHYFPVPEVEPLRPPADFAQRAGRFVGSYRGTGRAYTNLENFAGVFGQLTLAVRDPGDGTLLITTPWGDWRFVEVEPLHFRKVDGPFNVVFREDERGNIAQMFTDYTPMYTFEKLAWYETPGFNMPLLLACILIFLSIIPVAVIRAIRNRRRGDGSSAPGGARAAAWILLGVCALNLLLVAGTIYYFTPWLAFGVPTGFRIVLGLGVLSALLTAGALVYTILAWKDRYWGIAFRIYYTLVTIAAVAFVWFLNNWNLLGWRY